MSISGLNYVVFESDYIIKANKISQILDFFETESAKSLF